jgi:arylsulfatase A-like enzyme
MPTRLASPTVLIRLLCACVVAMVSALAASARGGAQAATVGALPGRPNIVVFVSDDHRADVLGCAGHPVVLTPNIDRLAAGGVRFGNAFASTSICAASRATILTGLPEAAHHYTFGRPPLAASLVAESYPARLRDAGYRTGFVGKLGVSIEGGRASIDRMFDSFAPLSRTPYRKPQPDGSVRHVTDIAGDEAIAFIRAAPADRPFCLSVSFDAAHAEDGDLADHYPPADAERALYEGIAMPRPRLDDPAVFEALPAFLRESMNRDRYHWRWDTPEKYERNMRNYLRLLTGLDRNIGRVMAELERTGRAGDTVILFLGDNGYYMAERGLAGKWTHFEESLRIPLVVHDPRVPSDARGRVDEALVLNDDIAPTILALAGLDASIPAAGGRVLPLVGIGKRAPAREGFHCGHGMKHPRIPRWIGWRTADTMYARYIDQGAEGEFLHDLSLDPAELVNLAGDPARADALAAMRAASASAHAAARAAGPALPRVLLLGDSISMGYHGAVVAGLDDEAVVVRPKENCEGTTKGLKRIDAWLALEGGGFDVVHFNFGLHDLKRVKADGTNSNDPADGRQAEVDSYERQLRAIAEKIVASGARVVFATTTPVPDGGVRPHRDPADVVAYNDAARRVMSGLGIELDDLYAFAAPRLAALQKPVDVHFTEAGSRELGGVVAASIRAALQRARRD